MKRALLLTPGLAAGVLLCLIEPAAGCSRQQRHPKVGSQTLHVRCEFQWEGQDQSVETDLELASEMTLEELDQQIELPGGRSPLRLLKYVPLGEFEQSVVPDESAAGQPAVKVMIEGPKLSHQRWMIADNPLRNRMNSLIGSWQLLQVADQDARDELFARFQSEPLRSPRVLVRQGQSKLHELPAVEGEDQELEELGCSVRILKFYPHYGIDPITRQPANLSEHRRNPAVLLEIHQGTQTEERWVYARPSAQEPVHRELLPYKLTLDCPIEQANSTPSFVILTVGRERIEIWTRYDQAVTWTELELAEVLAIPGSQYSFHISHFVPSGRLIETYLPTDNWKQGKTALQVEFTDPVGTQVTRWLVLDQKQTFNTDGGPLMVQFGPRR